MNEIHKGKQFVLKPGHFWILDQPIIRFNHQDRYIITEEDYDFWPMTLKSIQGNLCRWQHPKSNYMDYIELPYLSYCQDVEFKSIRIFIPSRLNLIDL